MPTSAESAIASRRSSSPISAKSSRISAGGSKAFEIRPTFSPSARERVDHVDYRSLQAMGRAPDPVLGHDEAAHSVIVPVGVERAEERPDLGRVVDLVLPLADEERQQLPAVGVGEGRLRGRTGAEGSEATNVPLDEQLRIEFPGDQVLPQSKKTARITVVGRVAGRP